MAILEIIEAPHPILAVKARKVEAEEFGPELRQRCEDMAETMYAAPGVGLAGPQVSDSRRIVVADPGFEGEDGERMRGKSLLFMINPEIIDRQGVQIYEESCLSVPEFYVDVERAMRVKLRWQRPLDGEHVEQWFEEFPAVVVQHELDHLEGVILLDRASRLKKQRYLKRKQKESGRRPIRATASM